MNLNIKNWDIWKPNDWVTVEAIQGIWDIVDGDRIVDTKKCLYEIQFSKSRNMHRLQTDGYNPKLHTVYSEVVNHFNNEYLKKS